MDEQGIIADAYDRAFALYQGEKEPPSLAAPYSGYLGVIIERQERNKGVLAVLITLLVKKLHTPDQDIRQHRAELKGGFSGRGLDTLVITPFLRDRQFPNMSESGWLTRSLEHNHPYDLVYPGKITPMSLKQAFLGLVHGVQCQSLSAETVLQGIFAGLIRFRDQNTNLVLSRPVNLSVEQVVDKVNRHHRLQISGVARLPVLAVHLGPSWRRTFNPAFTGVANTSPNPGRRKVWTSSSQLRAFTRCLHTMDVVLNAPMISE